MATTKQKPQTADDKFGYVFGCEGVADLSEACQLLGVSSFNTVRKFHENGWIRMGKHKGGSYAKNVVCRRSIREYNASLEK